MSTNRIRGQVRNVGHYLTPCRHCRRPVYLVEIDGDTVIIDAPQHLQEAVGRDPTALLTASEHDCPRGKERP